MLRWLDKKNDFDGICIGLADKQSYKTSEAETGILQRGWVSNIKLAVPWLRRLVASLSSRRLGFEPGSVHVGFVVDKAALGQVFPRLLRFSHVNFITPILHYLEK
jgi:hypothetical protein